MNMTQIRKISDTWALQNEKLTFPVMSLTLETVKVYLNGESSQDNSILVIGSFLPLFERCHAR